MQRRTPIGPEETAGELTARLAELGAELLVVTLDGLASGIVQPREQDEALATFAPEAAQGGRPDRLVAAARGRSWTSCAASTPGRGRTRTSTASR